MDKLVIVGASGSAIELIDVIHDINRVSPKWDIIGMLDDDPKKQRIEYEGVHVIGTLDMVDSLTTHLFILVLGSHKNLFIRKRIHNKFSPHNLRYATIVHPSANISHSAKVGEGCMIMQNAIVGPYVSVGNHVMVYTDVTIAHESIIEDFVTIASGAKIAGRIRVKEGAYIATNASVVGGIIEKWNLVGAGSVISGNTCEGDFILGNPGRIMDKLQIPEDIR